MKRRFDECLTLIESKKVRDFVVNALAFAPKEFWSAPNSDGGKDNVEGGIIIHSLKVVRLIINFCDFFGISEQLTRDKLIAAGVLHDVQRNGIPWGANAHPEHGHIAAQWLLLLRSFEASSLEDLYFNTDKDLIDIIELVENHMGPRNKPYPTLALRKVKGGVENEKGYLVDEKAIWHLIVQMADYLASIGI